MKYDSASFLLNIFFCHVRANYFIFNKIIKRKANERKFNNCGRPLTKMYVIVYGN